MTIGSLFSGIGGLELGLERAGLGPTIWQVERDPYAQRILERHWPDARRFDDVRTVGAHNLAPVDLICGGFPCQDISVAGKGAGLDGERSGLWVEFARIVRELRPRFVVVENVPALLARGFGRVLGDLAACGYDAEWDCIPAAAVGAPHLRDRLFVVAYPQRHALRQQSVSELGGFRAAVARDDGAPGAVAYPNGGGALESEGGVREVGGRAGDSGAEMADADRERREKRDPAAFAGYVGLASWRAAQEGRAWLPEPNVGRVADGVPARMDRLRCLGNAVVPQVAEVIGRAIMDSIREAA